MSDAALLWCASGGLAVVVAAHEVIEIAHATVDDVDLGARWELAAVDVVPRTLCLRRGRRLRVPARVQVVDGREVTLQPLPALCAGHLVQLGVAMIARRGDALGYLLAPERLGP